MPATKSRSTVKESNDILPYLEAPVGELIQMIDASPMWTELTSANPDKELVREFIKEVYLEIYGYQAQVIEATIAVIGQMPRSIDDRKIRSMLIHQAEEFSHGEMAIRDYVAMGGDELYARTKKPSPAAFATAACWRMIAHMRDPFMYLGALYLFEGLTPIVAGKAKGYLNDIGIPKESMEFLEFHAVADLKHTNLVRHLIKEVTAQFPEAIESAKYGLDCFLHVYPIPVWMEAWARAKANLGRA